MDRIGGFIMNVMERDMVTPAPAEEAILFSTEKSRGKAIGNFQEMDKAIAAWLKCHEIEYNALCGYMADIPKTDNTDDAQRALYNQWYQKWLDGQRGTMTNSQLVAWDKLFNKNGGSRIMQRADMKQESVQAAELELVKKCQEGGVYRKQADTLAQKYGALATRIEALANKLRDEPARGRGVATLISMYNKSVRNLGATIRGSMNYGTLRMGSKKPFPIQGEGEKATESFSEFLGLAAPAD